MQKNNRYYTFLLSHTTKEKIYIRRLEISKNLLHTSVASVLFFFGITSLGVFGLVQSENISLASLSDSPGIATVASLNPNTETKKVYPIETKSIDYSRPGTLNDAALNSGGPSNFSLTADGSSKEETKLEKRLRLIERTSSPEYLPTIWAHLGKINNEFGFRRNPFGGRSYEFHSGMDIDGDRGDMVVAPADGKVKTAGWQGGYGRLIEIDHGNGLTTRYGHLSKLEVKEGDRIKRGQLIALVGSTGRSTGPHLHYELRLDKKAINPRRFLPPEPTKIVN